jgi:hypothetical protein
MKRHVLRPLLRATLLSLALWGCAAAPPKKSASNHKAPPTPAERLAIKHYKEGIDAYANDHYAEAIDHWKLTLANDPQNPNAAQYIARAENMLKATKGHKKPKLTPTPTPSGGAPVTADAP